MAIQEIKLTSHHYHGHKRTHEQRSSIIKFERQDITKKTESIMERGELRFENTNWVSFLMP